MRTHLSSLKTFTPGKLYIAGEYSVVSRDTPAWIIPTSQGVTCQIESHSTFQYISAHKKHTFDQTFEAFHYNPLVKTIMQHIKAYLEDTLEISLHPFKLTLTSTLSKHKKSLGLGSSGAITVALINTILQFHGVSLDALTLYKSAVLAQINDLDNASYGDLAVAAYKSPILYHPFNKELFYNREVDIMTPWDGLSIQPFSYPFLPMSVINLRKKVSSQKLVKAVLDSKNHTAYEAFKKQIHAVFKRLINAQQNEDTTRFLTTINTLFQLYASLGKACDVALLTPSMRAIEKSLSPEQAMKFSGAGGGDNVLVFHARDALKTDFDATIKKQRNWLLLNVRNDHVQKR